MKHPVVIASGRMSGGPSPSTSIPAAITRTNSQPVDHSLTLRIALPKKGYVEALPKRLPALDVPYRLVEPRPPELSVPMLRGQVKRSVPRGPPLEHRIDGHSPRSWKPEKRPADKELSSFAAASAMAIIATGKLHCALAWPARN